MNENIRIEFLTFTEEYKQQISNLFTRYYKSMSDKGLLIEIIENGGEIWIESIKFTLGKNNQVVIARDQDQIVGFVWGCLRYMPPYLGGNLVGVWNALYILPEFRDRGLSKELYLKLESWLREKKVNSIEAQVLVDNQHSIKGIENMGYKKELFQTRKTI